MRLRLLIGLVLLLALGCKSKGFAPVSGTVTLNGKPLANATVNFQPVSQNRSIDAGAGSTGKTNDKGEYTLTASTGQPGALVGKHKVMITVLSQQQGNSDERPPRGGWPMAEQIPDRYNNQTILECVVLAGGNDKANFALTSP